MKEQKAFEKKTRVNPAWFLQIAPKDDRFGVCRWILNGVCVLPQVSKKCFTCALLVKRKQRLVGSTTLVISEVNLPVFHVWLKLTNALLKKFGVNTGV